LKYSGLWNGGEKHMTEQKPPPAGEPGQTPPPQPGERTDNTIDIDDGTTDASRDVPPGGIPKPEPLPPLSAADDFEFDEVGPDIEVTPSNSEWVDMPVLQPYKEGFIRMIPTAPGDVRDVPPGGIPKPEPLPTFAPDTASDAPGRAEQQPQGIDPNLLDPPSSGDPAVEGVQGVPSPDVTDYVVGDTGMAEAPSPEVKDGAFADINQPASDDGSSQTRGEAQDAPPDDWDDYVIAPPPAPAPPVPHPETLDPNLLDPIVPGPTLDTGLVERITQSPGLVEAVNQDPALAEALEQDPTYLYQIEQDLGLAEQWSDDAPSFTDPSFMDPGLTEQPLPDQSTPDDGADYLTL
jgi:hypothetical protein